MIYLAIMGSRKYRELQHNKNTRIVGCHVKNAKFWLNEKADELASVGSVAVTENTKQLQQPVERDSPASQCGLTYHYLQRDSTRGLQSDVSSRSGPPERTRKEGVQKAKGRIGNTVGRVGIGREGSGECQAV